MKSKYLLLLLSIISNALYANDCLPINANAKITMSQNQITGMAIAIINGSKVTFCNYGYTNKDRKHVITNKSLFEIASITKTFTALLAGIAVADNKLDLNTPITHHLPELTANKNYEKINNTHLLTHVAGLPLGFQKSHVENELLNSVIQMKFRSQPASYYEYSNSGIALSGLSLTRIYKRTYQGLLNKLILNPLNMKYTSIEVSEKNKELLVTGYNKKNQPVGLMELGIENPSGGLKSNTLDLAKYLQLQINPHNSKLAQALAIVHENYFCLYKDGTYQQLAWEYHPLRALNEKFKADINNRNILPPHTLAKHCLKDPNGFIDKNGNSPGMTSYIGYIPNKKIGVVILSNRALRPDIVNLGRYILQKIENVK